MFAKVFGLLTPEFKLNFLANRAGLSAADLVSVNETLQRVSSIPAVAMFLGGRELSLANLIAVVTSPEPYKAAGAALPALQSLIATDEGASTLATAAEQFIAQDPNGDLIAGIFSRLSKLPVVGFGDVEHAGVGDFLRRAVFPLLRKQPEAAPADLVVPFKCRYCGHVDHISVNQPDHLLHSCTGCAQTQLVNVIQG